MGTRFRKSLVAFWRVVRRPLLRFAFAALVIAVVVTGAILCAYLPPPGVASGNAFQDQTFAWKFHPDQFDPPARPWSNSFLNNYSVLLDGHSHTNFGPNADGDMTPRQNIEWHIANGFNAAVVSDHNELQSAREAQRIARAEYAGKFVVLLGQEYSCCRVHLNLIGIQEVILPSSPFPTDAELKKVIHDTHAQGGLVNVNHLVWNQGRLTDMPSISDWIDWGVDSFTVVHDWTFLLTVNNVLEAHYSGKVGVLTSTDVHDPTEHQVYGWTTLNPSNFTEEAIMNELRSKRASFIYDEFGSPFFAEAQPARAGAAFLRPWFVFGKFLLSQFVVVQESMYSFVSGQFCGPTGISILWGTIFLWIAWAVLIWFVLEVLAAVIPVAVKRCRRNRTCSCGSKNSNLSSYDLFDSNHKRRRQELEELTLFD